MDSNSKEIVKSEIKWSDVVAGRNVRGVEEVDTPIQNIKTIITSRKNQNVVERKRNGKESSISTMLPTFSKKINQEDEDGRKKMIIIGDSYVLGFASELTQRLGTRYKIIGYVKPNVEVSELIDTAKDEVSELTGKDIVIFCGGANNMDRNTAGKGLSQVINFLRTNQHTNIIFISIPYRFDQKIRLSMNEDIRNYNTKLNRLIKLSKRAHFVNAVTDRHFFTRHGMHMNVKGKEAMVRKLIEIIQVMFDKYESHMTIPLSWKNDITKQENTQELTNISIVNTGFKQPLY